MPEDPPFSLRPIRPMARPRRRAGRLIALFFLIVAIPFAVLYLRRQPPARVEHPAPSPAPASDAAWRARPGQTDAFSDSLASRLAQGFAELGVPPEEVRRARSKREGLLAETTVRVPKDLPLAACNLEIVRQAERIGGGVLSAVEARDGLSLDVQVGLGGRATDRVALTVDPNLTRPAGMVALIVCAAQGQDGQVLEDFCGLDQRITLALPPDLNQAPQVSERAQAGGHGVVALLPVEGIEGKAGALLRQAVEGVPGAAGVMNDPENGRATEDERAMNALLSEVRRRNLFFVDSRASASSVAYRAALRTGVRSGESVMRVDEMDGVETIREALGRLADLSGAEGRVIGTASARPNTLAAMREALPALERRGVRFVRAEQVVRR